MAEDTSNPVTTHQTIETEDEYTVEALPIFTHKVLEAQGGSAEDASSAPLPLSYPYKTRMSRRVYEHDKQLLQIELLKLLLSLFITHLHSDVALFRSCHISPLSNQNRAL